MSVLTWCHSQRLHSPFLSFHGSLPPQLDGVRLDVGYVKVAYFECWGEHGALEGTPSCDSLVQVEGCTQFPLKGFHNDVLHCGCPTASPQYLHLIYGIDRQAWKWRVVRRGSVQWQ